VYKVLKKKDVPNVDRLMLSYADDAHGAVAFLEPKGINIIPGNTCEVLEAASCVLEALAVMHDGKKPIFHRDIRWPNVIRRSDDSSKWFLIDWDDAATAPTRAATHLKADCHAPSIFSDKHGGEVDVWAVGRLFVEASQHTPDFPSDIVTLGEDMQAGTLDANQALNRVTAFRRHEV